MSFFVYLLIGVIIGTGFIIPGVSGGALAVILGVYDKIFNSFKNIKNKENFIFLSTITLGIVLGIIGFGNLLLLLLDTREVPTKYIFIGLVIGGIPSLIKSIKEKSNNSFKLIPFLIAILLSIGLFMLEKKNFGINISSEMSAGNTPIIGLFIAGILYSVGKIVPGISGSALLMLVGMYEYFLKVIANPFAITGHVLFSLIPFFLGVFIGMLVLFKLMNYLFAKYYIKTYSAILGFVIGSLLYLYPGFNFDITGLICIVLLISSTAVSYMLTK